MASRFTWETSVSVGFVHCSEERMREFEQSDIRFIELSVGRYTDFADYPERAKMFCDTAAAHGVTIRSIHLPFFPFDDIDPAHIDQSVRKRFLEVQRPIIEASAKNGIGIAVVHPSGEPYAEEARAQHMAYAIESLSALTDFAADCGMKIAIENLPRTCLGRNCADMKTMLDSIPKAYACFDTNHSLIDSNIDLIKTMGSRIIATHVSDYDFIDERHLFPGEGKNNWQDIMAALEEVGYSGTWNYETKNVHASVYKENHNKLLSGK